MLIARRKSMTRPMSGGQRLWPVDGVLRVSEPQLRMELSFTADPSKVVLGSALD